ncbi:MAG: DUF6876 family protein [Cyanobacteria bacterium P01_A01_bin.17]
MTLTAIDLRQLTGTKNWCKYPLISGYAYTDGVRYAAAEGEAYWLLNAIFSHQLHPKVKAEPFQVWTLTTTDSSANLTCEDSNGNQVTQQDISYTDFPLPKISFYLINKILLLTSEY